MAVRAGQYIGCGVVLPVRYDEAVPLAQPVAAMMSASLTEANLGRMTVRKPSRSTTASGFSRFHCSWATLASAMARPRR
jgi:hypothetical protein